MRMGGKLCDRLAVCEYPWNGTGCVQMGLNLLAVFTFTSRSICQNFPTLYCSDILEQNRIHAALSILKPCIHLYINLHPSSRSCISYCSTCTCACISSLLLSPSRPPVPDQWHGAEEEHPCVGERRLHGQG